MARTLRLRPVTDGDCRLLWTWVNDPAVRRSAFTSSPISWNDHQAWFARTRIDPACWMYVVLDGRDRPIGQVRVDRQADGAADIDVSVARTARGQGVGTAALRMACEELARTAGIRQVVARIKPTNTASIRTFERAGFVANGREWVWHASPRKPVYLVAGCRPWSRRVFREQLSALPGRWIFAERPEHLALARVERLAPRYVFFLHWSWRVPTELLERYECIGFHMTELPYGRGGSPLQHLILRGRRHTTLTAFRMTEAMDAGPVYLKAAFRLNGTAEKIYLRASRLAARMIRDLIRHPHAPAPQRGRAVHFVRRRPSQSRVPPRRSLRQLYDFIRMLDADGYPRAFLRSKGLRYEFSRPALTREGLIAQVRVRSDTEGSPA